MSVLWRKLAFSDDLGTAATRDAEDTLTDGSNLPDGAAIKAYGDAHWGGSSLYAGTGTFAGLSGATVSIGETLAGTAYRVAITPIGGN